MKQAASAVPALVMARGHRIDGVNEIPFVLGDDFAKVDKTGAALKVRPHTVSNFPPIFLSLYLSDVCNL